ncbi:MAG: zinc ribbon domain-containing protein [Eubacteriales bacterium]
MTYLGTYVFLIAMGFFLLIIIGLGVFVFVDAPKYNMNKWLWILVVCLTPNFIGLIIYLLIRSNNKKEKCIRCNNEIKKDFNICPYCEHDLRLKCSNCKKEISEEWKVCPYCENLINN